MKNTYRAGLFAEWVARQYLRLHGFCILESRYITGRNTGRAEIDIIARRGDLVLFVEVKNRPDAIAGLDAVSFWQRGRLRSAAEVYLRRARHMGPARFDIIVVSWPKVSWIKGAI
jgi:putative endonuclease